LSIVPDTKVLYFKLLTPEYTRESRGIYLKLAYTKLNEKAISLTIHLKHRDIELLEPTVVNVSSLGVNETKQIEISKPYYQLPSLETITAMGSLLNVTGEKVFKVYSTRPVLIMAYGLTGSRLTLLNNLTGETIGEYSTVDVTGDGYGVLAVLITTTAQEVELRAIPDNIDFYDIIWIRYVDLPRIRKSCLLLVEETRTDKVQTYYQTIQGYMILVTLAIVTFEVTELLGGL